MFNNHLPKTAEEYILCFRQLASIVNDAFNYALAAPALSDSENSESLRRLAEAVETIAALRGDTALFSGSRPNNLSEYQKEMYSIENYLRDRLIKLGYTYPKK